MMQIQHAIVHERSGSPDKPRSYRESRQEVIELGPGLLAEEMKSYDSATGRPATHELIEGPPTGRALERKQPTRRGAIPATSCNPNPARTQRDD
jgi:hypothetical protein